MEFIKVDGHWYIKIPYKDFIASNLSENGSATFTPNSISTSEDKIQKFIDEKGRYIGQVKHLHIRVYDKKKNEIECYHCFLNDKKVSAIGFFDFIKLMCGRFDIKDFYACDFATNEIYKMNLVASTKIGTLKDFQKIFNLNENRYLIVRQIKFARSEGLSYFTKPQVFRNEIDRDFFTYKEIIGEKNFDKYNSLQECSSHLNKAETILTFDKDTILDFDIDNPLLTLKTRALRARNLNIKNLIATDQDVFCDRLKCCKIKANSILAEAIECESIQARAVKVNYNYGIKMK